MDGDTLGNIMTGVMSASGLLFLKFLYGIWTDHKHGKDQQRRSEIDHMASQLETVQAALVTAKDERDVANEHADQQARRARIADKEHASQLRRVAFENGFTIPSWPGGGYVGDTEK